MSSTMADVQRGKKLKELREAAGLTQEEVGLEFSVRKQAVSEWENGKSRPDVLKLRKLDDLYGAGGRVLGVFDLGSAEVSQLRAEVAELRQAVRELQQHAKEAAGPPASGPGVEGDEAPPSSP